MRPASCSGWKPDVRRITGSISTIVAQQQGQREAFTCIVETCCASISRSISGAGPEAQPSRMPLPSTLEKESSRSTRPSTSIEAKEPLDASPYCKA